MKKIIYSILLTLASTTAIAANELESMIPTKVKGTLSYATHKYWITDSSGKAIELSVTDEVVDKLKLYNKDGGVVELDGSILTYSDGSVYFKPSLHKQAKKAQLDITVKGSEPYNVEILIDDKSIFSSERYREAEIKKVFVVENGKLAFIQLFTGGTLCPANSMIIFARYDSEPLMTPIFGTCSDIPDFTDNGNKILIKFPGNPAENWVWDNQTLTLSQQ